MSRTYRKIPITQCCYPTYETEQQFNEAVAHFNSCKDNPVPEVIPRPERVRQGPFESTQEYHKRVNAVWSEYYKRLYTPEYIDYKRCQAFLKEARHCRTYRDYVRMHQSKAVSDTGTGQRNAPKWFRQMIEVSRRAKAKQVISAGLKYDNWDETCFDHLKKNANWYYW